MITKENCHILTKAIVKSIQEFVPSNQKILLIDALYFISLTTEYTQVCTNKDIQAISDLFEFCEKLNIDPAVYLSCAYSYIEKYHTKGRKLALSYILSDNVASYVSSKIKLVVSSEGLISTKIRNDITNTEKQIRIYSKDTNCSYAEAFNMFYKLGRVSDIFLLYKVYLGYEPLAKMKLSPNMSSLYSALEPMFIAISSKFGQHSATKGKTWSNSKIETFSFCPVFFRDRYLNDDIPPKYLGNEASETGTKVHSVFEDIINRYNKSKTKNISAIFERYMKSKPFLAVKDDIIEHMPGIISFFTDQNSQLLMNLKPDTRLLTEEQLSLYIDDKDVTFTGIADLIIINGNEAIVVDYKTSKIDSNTWLLKNNDKYHKQLSLYANFIEKTFNLKVTKLVVVYTRGLIKEFDTINTEIVTERLNDIDKIRLAIKLNNFPINNRSCRLCRHPRCPFRTDESMWDEDGKRKPK